MPHSCALGFQIAHQAPMELDRQRDPSDQLQSPVLNGVNFFGVVRNEAYTPQPKIAQDLGALFVQAQIDVETQTLVCLDRVGSRVLQSVGTYLIDDADPAPFLLLINDHAAI